MWSHFKILRMTDVEKSEISFNMCTINGILLHFKLFCCKICVFLRFTLFCRKIGLLRFTRFCVEKILAKNSVRGEKMTNIRYGVAGLQIFTLHSPLSFHSAKSTWQHSKKVSQRKGKLNMHPSFCKLVLVQEAFSQNGNSNSLKMATLIHSTSPREGSHFLSFPSFSKRCRPENVSIS